jgi:hypothetical protein
MSPDLIKRFSKITNNPAATLCLFSDVSAVALHESAHLVAALSRQVAVREVWIKGICGSGQPRRTRGSDGRVLVLPDNESDDAFVSYAGFAWEEIHGDTDYAASDLAQAQRMCAQDELQNARVFVTDFDRLIRQTAVLLLVCRTKSGWLKDERLSDVCYWVECRYGEKKNSCCLTTYLKAKPS